MQNNLAAVNFITNLQYQFQYKGINSQLSKFILHGIKNLFKSSIKHKEWKLFCLKQNSTCNLYYRIQILKEVKDLINEFIIIF